MRPDRKRSSRRRPDTMRIASTIAYFYEAVRSRKRPVEDAVFGFRAAGPALLANVSYFERRICTWDADRMTAA